MGILNFVSLALGILGTLAAIVFGFATFRRNTKADDTNSGKKDGVMMSDIGYIKAGVDDIKRKQESQDKLNLEIMQMATKAKDSAESAHKRIDRLDERIEHLGGA